MPFKDDIRQLVASRSCYGRERVRHADDRPYNISLKHKKTIIVSVANYCAEEN